MSGLIRTANSSSSLHLLQRHGYHCNYHGPNPKATTKYRKLHVRIHAQMRDSAETARNSHSAVTGNTIQAEVSTESQPNR